MKALSFRFSSFLGVLLGRKQVTLLFVALIIEHLENIPFTEILELEEK